MATVIAGMTTSLDGFVADESGSAARLYPDLSRLRGTPYMDTAIAETGAVVMGRRTFAMGDPDDYVGTYEFQVPIFVVTHEPPAAAPQQNEHLTFTFVTDGAESAVLQASDAAGDKVVQVVGGPALVGQLLRAGLVDELRVDVMPVFLGSGLRFLDAGWLEGIALEKIGVQEVGERTSLAFAIRR
jgi:dihydrofolate reductase